MRGGGGCPYASDAIPPEPAVPQLFAGLRGIVVAMTVVHFKVDELLHYLASLKVSLAKIAEKYENSKAAILSEQ